MGPQPGTFIPNRNGLRRMREGESRGGNREKREGGGRQGREGKRGGGEEKR